MDLTNKIDKLQEKLEGGREDSLAEVTAMRRSFKEATMRKALAGNPTMAKLLGLLKKREASITSVIDNKEVLADLDRAKLFARRKEVRFFLSFFEAADNALKTLEIELDYQLSEEVRVGSVDNEG